MEKELEKKKKKTEVQRKDHTWKCRTHKGEPSKEKTQNLGPKPITSNTEQVVQGDGWKPERTPSL
jgi:hypothetical protein